MRITTRRGRGGEVSHPSLSMRPASPSPAAASARPLGMLVTQPKDDGDSLVFVWTDADGSGTPIGGVHKRGLFCASSLRHSAITRTRTAADTMMLMGAAKVFTPIIFARLFGRGRHSDRNYYGTHFFPP